MSNETNKLPTLDKIRQSFTKEFTILEDEREEEPDHCGGLFYRVAREAWKGSDADICFRFRFRPLTNRSCTGCDLCSWLLEDLDTRLYDYNAGHMDYDFDSLSHGMLVELKVTGVSTDWETGVVDDYDIEFIEVKE